VKFDEYTPQGYMVHLDTILASQNKLPTYIIRAAKELRETSYLTAGDFFEKLEDVEVLHLAVLMNSLQMTKEGNFIFDSREVSENLYHLSLVCFLLALGEGSVEVTPELLQELLLNLFLLIAVENLYRRGKVEVFRENFSVIDSFRPIARVIKGEAQ